MPSGLQEPGELYSDLKTANFAILITCNIMDE